MPLLILVAVIIGYIINSWTGALWAASGTVVVIAVGYIFFVRAIAKKFSDK